MTILVDTLRISGFRGIQNLEITFAPMTVLIGPNNSGKTTVLKALGLALGDYGRYVTEEDFYIRIDDQGNESKATEIVVDARIVSLGADEQRTNVFEENWQAELGGTIQAEANGKQYVAIRTKCFPNMLKGGFEVERYTMERWPDSSSWLTGAVKLTKMHRRLEALPFFSIEAQRDIHSELKDKSSFVGKVLSGVNYDKRVIEGLEKMIEDVNKEAVEKSKELQRLKDNLTQLNHTFQGAGSAEITPFPKKVRDFSKNFSVHFGEISQNTFTMEYHGMGTRSWASILTVKAFMDARREKYEEEVKLFFPIVATEEPEAHLHPNAQKTLYRQLSEMNAQVIVSTHSPYFTAMSDITHVRSLKNTSQGIVVAKLDCLISDKEKKILAREVLARRGEILFSRALILCEGMTEEQVIPAMFEVFSNGQSLFNLGISCISVGGRNYTPFVKLACSFGIPIFIIGDNDSKNNISSKTKVETQIKELREAGFSLDANNFGVSYCGDTNDFENEIVKVLKIITEINDALVLCATSSIEKNLQHEASKKSEISALSEDDRLKRMKDFKTCYSGFLADIIRQNPNKKPRNDLIIQAALDAFNTIKNWILV